MAFTYFFRDMYTLRLIERHVIPQLKSRRYLSVWDAGCATGAEPYSLAIMFRENMGEFLFRNLQIHATDINPSFGAIIRRGLYREEEVRRIPRALLEKYFVPAEEPDHYMIAEPLRQAVSFQHHDLTSLQPIREGLCLILCKNVLLHLTREQVVAVLKMFHSVLDEGGFFVTEQTQKMPPESTPWFHRAVGDGQVFQRV